MLVGALGLTLGTTRGNYHIEVYTYRQISVTDRPRDRFLGGRFLDLTNCDRQTLHVIEHVTYRAHEGTNLNIFPQMPTELDRGETHVNFMHRMTGKGGRESQQRV